MEFSERVEILHRLVDENPRQAVSEALDLSGNINVDLLKAAILVDAGGLLKDFESVLKGVEIFRYVVGKCKDSSELNYNLANGLHALALSTTYEGYSWYGVTEKYRLEARQLFYKAATDEKASLDTRSQSFTNLGNLLWSSYRWVEAYDFYSKAVEENPKNAVASSGALKMLRYALGQGLGDHDLVTAEIEHLASHVNNNIETIYSYSGEYGVSGIMGEITDIRASRRSDHEIQAGSYERFVVKNNLTLSPTIHSHSHDSEYWDNINISSVTSPTGSEGLVPEIFAMVNVLKSDYILARQVLFDARNDRFSETGNYNDTLDYACYGVNESALALAQRSALDILDKIAVASLSYLGIGGAKEASMKTAWFKKAKKGQKKRELATAISIEVENGNTALLALTEVSRDLSSKQGFLSTKQGSRNSSTHRFTVLHDMGVPSTKSTSGCVEHFDVEEFARESIQTLKLARAAVVYFVQMVLIREKRLSGETDGISVPLFVPSHEYIRGGDE
ncbi:LA2681 family HEPN domain-containing protein [Halomonas sp.]|uniref:LA2681 family HEPN domain-containing protein n=1 Tax=Halomonas sp. TaxID=1486246 RepID=UPI00298EC2F0|nr:LA2681 family HEPN domain-containing protein [Halomonas sp.]MDW7746683.1 LA2681 family HEPN domain-containing protein [Halomonas sp.]